MKSFKEFIAEDGIDYFVIDMPVDQISKQALLNEGQWVQSGKKDWMQRVDPEDPSIKLQRHVHIAKAKHMRNKNMQASWNQDGTKHDSKSFNVNIGSLNAVQSIAKQALNLSANVKLEESSRAASILMQLNESIDIGGSPVLFKLTQA